jgi:hypothetical protein
MVWKQPMDSNPASLVLHSVLGVALGLALSACSSDTKKEPEPNIFPADYKQEILDAIPSVIAELGSIRDAYVSDPTLVQGGRDQRYAVCVRFVARNESRQDAGSKDRIGYFYAGRLNQLIEAEKGQCATASYKPFPEVVCYPKTCS